VTNLVTDIALSDAVAIMLVVTRSDGNYLEAPDGDTIIPKNDVLILYGRANVNQELDCGKPALLEIGNIEKKLRIKKIEMI
jgi:uncharacterized protein with PhoU and TrkA domain